MFDKTAYETLKRKAQEVEGKKDGLVIPTSVKFKGDALQLYPFQEGLPMLLLGSIQNNSLCEGEYLTLTINKAFNEGRNLTFLAVDELHWHNLKPSRNVSDDEKTKLQAQALTMGEDYIRRNLVYICKAVIPSKQEVESLVSELQKLPIEELIKALNQTINRRLNQNSYASFKLIRWQDWCNINRDEERLVKNILGEDFLSDPMNTVKIERVDAIYKKLWTDYNTFLHSKQENRLYKKRTESPMELSAEELLERLHVCSKLLYAHFEVEILKRFSEDEKLKTMVDTVASDFCKRHQTSNPSQQNLDLIYTQSFDFVTRETAALTWITAKSGISFIVYPGDGMSFLDIPRLYFTGLIKRPSTGEVFDLSRANDPLMIHVERDRPMATFLKAVFNEKKNSPILSSVENPSDIAFYLEAIDLLNENLAKKVHRLSREQRFDMIKNLAVARERGDPLLFQKLKEILSDDKKDIKTQRLEDFCLHSKLLQKPSFFQTHRDKIAVAAVFSTGAALAYYINRNYKR